MFLCGSLYGTTSGKPTVTFIADTYFVEKNVFILPSGPGSFTGNLVVGGDNNNIAESTGGFVVGDNNSLSGLYPTAFGVPTP